VTESRVWTATIATCLVHGAFAIIPMDFSPRPVPEHEGPVKLHVRSDAPPSESSPPRASAPVPKPEPASASTRSRRFHTRPTPVQAAAPVPVVTEAAAPIVPSSIAQPEPVVVASASIVPTYVQNHVSATFTTAAPKATLGGADLRAYARIVHAAIARHKRYPPAALRLGLEGIAKIKLSVDRSGALAAQPELVQSSGHTVLDEEAVRVVRTAAPFAALPSGAHKPVFVFVVPIEFRVVDG